VSYGRLDIWDIWRIEWWETVKQDQAEQSLLTEYSPYLNFDGDIELPPTESPICIGDPDGQVALMTEDEAEFRSEPYNRAKQKLEHISRMLDKIKLADHSDETRAIVQEHHRILERNMREFIGLD